MAVYRRQTFYTGEIRLSKDLCTVFPELLIQMPSAPLFNAIRACYFRKFKKMNIGKHVHLFKGVHLRGNVTLEDNALVNEFCTISSSHPGQITIGEYTILAPYVYIRNSNHGFEDLTVPIRYQDNTVEDIHIGKDCWLGKGAVVLAGVTIGNGVVVGAGSVVTGNIPDYAIVAGVPAKIIRYRNEPHQPCSGDSLPRRELP